MAQLLQRRSSGLVPGWSSLFFAEFSAGDVYSRSSSGLVQGGPTSASTSRRARAQVGMIHRKSAFGQSKSPESRRARGPRQGRRIHQRVACLASWRKAGELVVDGGPRGARQVLFGAHSVA